MIQLEFKPMTIKVQCPKFIFKFLVCVCVYVYVCVCVCVCVLQG